MIQVNDVGSIKFDHGTSEIAYKNHAFFDFFFSRVAIKKNAFKAIFFLFLGLRIL